MKGLARFVGGRRRGALLLAGAAQAKDWKTVVIGMEGAYEPYNLTDPSGKIVGFEPDLAMDLCARMKVECKIIAQDWDGMIPGLKAGKFDVIMDGMSITDERKKSIDFPTPIRTTPRAFAAAKSSPLAKLAGQRQGRQLRQGQGRRRRRAEGAEGRAERQDDRRAGLDDPRHLRRQQPQGCRDDQGIQDHRRARSRPQVGPHRRRARRSAVDSARCSPKPDAKDFTVFGPQLTGGDFGVGVGMGIRKSRRGPDRQVQHGDQGRIRRRIDQEILHEVVQDRHHALIARS